MRQIPAAAAACARSIFPSPGVSAGGRTCEWDFFPQESYAISHKHVMMMMTIGIRVLTDTHVLRSSKQRSTSASRSRRARRLWGTPGEFSFLFFSLVFSFFPSRLWFGGHEVLNAMFADWFMRVGFGRINTIRNDHRITVQTRNFHVLNNNATSPCFSSSSTFVKTHVLKGVCTFVDLIPFRSSFSSSRCIGIPSVSPFREKFLVKLHGFYPASLVGSLAMCGLVRLFREPCVHAWETRVSDCDDMKNRKKHFLESKSR